MTELLSSPYVSAVGYFLGVLSIILAIVFYRKSRRTKRLTFALRSFNLISDSVFGLPGFEATYQGEILRDLTVMKILIWNSGTEIVSRMDIAEIDPIRIQLSGDVAALDAQVTAVSTQTNLVSLHINRECPNSITLSFDYFGAREGCLLSVLHTGTQDTEVSIKGSIKGHGQPRIYAGSKRSTIVQGLLTVFRMICSAIMGFVLVLWINSTWFMPAWSTSPWRVSTWTMVICFVAVLLVVLGSVLLEVRLSRKVGGYLDEKFEDAFASSDFTQQAPGNMHQ